MIKGNEWRWRPTVLAALAILTLSARADDAERAFIAQPMDTVIVAGESALLPLSATDDERLTDPPGLGCRVSDDGASDLPVEAGGYAVVATITDATFTGSSTGTLATEPPDFTGTYFGEFSSGAISGKSWPALSGSSAWGLTVSSGGSGIFLAYLPGGQSAILATLTVAVDGSFSVITPPFAVPAQPTLAGTVRVQALSGHEVTVSGSIGAGAVLGNIAELGLSFSGDMDTASGSAADASGFYDASVLGASSGEVHLLIGPGGRFLVVVHNSEIADVGVGMIGVEGKVAATLFGGAILNAAVDMTSGRLEGTLAKHGYADPLRFLGLSLLVPPLNDLVNLSTRGFVNAGDGVMILGFVISGAGTRRVLLRAIGPTLGTPEFGVDGALADPRLVLRRQSDGSEVAVNDDWGSNDNLQDISDAVLEVGAFPAPSGSLDAMLLLDLAAGGYTATAEGKGRTGVAITEVYTVGDSLPATARLTNLSTRGFVGSGDAILIPGLVTSGNAPRRLLIRAVGPTLGEEPFNLPGVLADPILRVFEAGKGRELAANDDWDVDGAGDAIEPLAQQVGAFDLIRGSRDAALVFVVPPDIGYTIQVSGRDGATGLVIAEVYEAE